MTEPIDAVLIPRSWGDGLDDQTYVDAICAYAEDVLGGGPVYVRAPLSYAKIQMMFASRNWNDTLFHEHGHPNQLKPRYTWTDREDGSRVGRLTPDAVVRPMTEPPSATVRNPLAQLAALRAEDAKFKEMRSAR